MKRISLVLALLTLGTVSTARGDQLGDNMADAARRFLGSLDDQGGAQARFAFDSPERFNWHWIPRERKGLPIKSLKGDQRALAFGLLDTGLSTKGAIKATTIMSLEEILRIDEHGTGPIRDPELYFVSVFGDPGPTGEWAWRIEGHHLALNFTLKDGKVISGTPFMFGSNPAKVLEGPRKGLRNLAEISDPAYELLHSLTESQLKQAVVADVAPEVTTTPNAKRPQDSTPEGIAFDKLNAAQQQTLKQLLLVYAINFPDPVRDILHDQAEANDQSLHLAWYGSTDTSKNHSFRIQGATVLVDFNNTQNGTNHIHTFYRSYVNDFGIPAPK